MKITIRELRSLISEALTSPSGAAVTVFKTPAMCKIILWSPQKLGEILDEKGFDSDIAIDHSYEDPFIYGVIGLDRLKNLLHGMTPAKVGKLSIVLLKKVMDR